MEPGKTVLWAGRREGHQVRRQHRRTEMPRSPFGCFHVVEPQGGRVATSGDEFLGGLGTVNSPKLFKPPQAEGDAHPFPPPSPHQFGQGFKPVILGYLIEEEPCAPGSAFLLLVNQVGKVADGGLVEESSGAVKEGFVSEQNQGLLNRC
jgi:hypothetical protein